MIEFHLDHDGLGCLTILAEPLGALLPTAVGHWKCTPLRPTLEIGFDIVAAIFQQA